MAYAESDRVNVRHLLGFAAIFQQADPRLENALTASQAVSDGGTRPDNSTETYIKATVTSALSVETKLAALWDEAEVLAGDEARIDPARGAALLRSEGRRLVHGIARMLGMRGPRADIFSAGRVYTDENPFAVEAG